MGLVCTYSCFGATSLAGHASLMMMMMYVKSNLSIVFGMFVQS